MRAQKAFTLVELLVTIAITGLLFATVGTVIYQLSTTSSFGNDKLTALHDVQNVTNQINADCQQAITAVGGSSLVLTLPSAVTVTYTLSGTNLQRTLWSSVLTLSQNVSNFSSVISGRKVTLNLDILIAGRNNISEPLSYQVNLRPSAQ
jgi:prepilin-type N-terminal cleavage/methylation domain-containing protein